MTSPDPTTLPLFDHHPEPDPLIKRTPVGETLDVGETAHGNGTATFDETRKYRYRLSRVWGDPAERVCFVMLNPSTADAFTFDKTVRRCWGYATTWGFGALEIVNVFALRSTDPSVLYGHPDPVGPANDEALVAATTDAGLVVAGWGAHGTLHMRGRAAAELVESAGVKLTALAVTNDGQPRHPLYLKKSLRPVPWTAD